MISVDRNRVELYFWSWWDSTSEKEGLLNAREAFEAGYIAGIKELEQ